jgi:hypothetical protein
MQLYDRVAYSRQGSRLRVALAALPPQLLWLPLLEPVNTKEYTVDKAIKKRAGVDTSLAVTLRFSPNDTLGAVLFSRLKTLSPQQRVLYNRVNSAIRGVTEASVISFSSIREDSTANRQFSRIIDSLIVRSVANPIRFSFAKGTGATFNLNYTTEAHGTLFKAGRGYATTNCNPWLFQSIFCETGIKSLRAGFRQVGE